MSALDTFIPGMRVRVYGYGEKWSGQPKYETTYA